MNIPNSIEHIRKLRKLYLGEAEPTGAFLTIHLAEGALTSGARRIELYVLDAGWFAVSADSDWITPNLPEKSHGVTLQRAFLGLMPQVGGRPNEVRFEPVLTAFSRSVCVKSGLQWLTISGGSPPQKVLDSLASSNFCVVFEPELKASC